MSLISRLRTLFSSREARTYIVLLLLCVGTRIASTIYYIEDPDSLRFALGVTDFDIAALQPHFPGYPVFCFVVWLWYKLTGSFALGFSITGSISVFVIILALQRMLRLAPDSPAGSAMAFLVFANPFIWLMSNRYMPDLMGTACVAASLWLLLFSEKKHAGAFLAGLLMGVRLSYTPFVLPALLFACIRQPGLVRTVSGFAAGILIWLVPMMALTGWDDLLMAARMQTTGHFEDFGGTISTEPDFGQRVLSMIENIVADGLGGYWTGRNWITIVTGLCMCIALLAGTTHLLNGPRARRPWIIAGSGILLYFLWILFFQNVVHQSRHILPLLPFLLIPAAIGCGELLRRKKLVYSITMLVFFGAYATLSGTLAAQHKRPTAIAQAKALVQSMNHDGLYIASVPLINNFLSAQGVRATFLSVNDSAHRKMLINLPAGASLVTIGDYRLLTGRDPAREMIFYHNPFVNRVWQRVVVHVYEGR